MAPVDKDSLLTAIQSFESATWRERSGLLALWTKEGDVVRMRDSLERRTEEGKRLRSIMMSSLLDENSTVRGNGARLIGYLGEPAAREFAPHLVLIAQSPLSESAVTTDFVAEGAALGALGSFPGALQESFAVLMSALRGEGGYRGGAQAETAAASLGKILALGTLSQQKEYSLALVEVFCLPRGGGRHSLPVECLSLSFCYFTAEFREAAIHAAKTDYETARRVLEAMPEEHVWKVLLLWEDTWSMVLEGFTEVLRRREDNALSTSLLTKLLDASRPENRLEIIRLMPRLLANLPS